MSLAFTCPIKNNVCVAIHFYERAVPVLTTGVKMHGLSRSSFFTFIFLKERFATSGMCHENSTFIIFLDTLPSQDIN